MESYIYVLCQFTNTRKTFFFENKCLFKYFKSIIYFPTFSSTDRSLCVFSLIFKYQEKCLFHLNIIPMKTTEIDHFKYQEKCLFHLNIFPMKTTYIDETVATLSLLSHFVFLIVSYFL